MCRDLELPQAVPPPPADVTLRFRGGVTLAPTRRAVALRALPASRGPSGLDVIVSQLALLDLLLAVQIHNTDLDLVLHSVPSLILNSDLGDLLGDQRYRAGGALHQRFPPLRAPVAAEAAEAGHEEEGAEDENADETEQFWGEERRLRAERYLGGGAAGAANRHCLWRGGGGVGDCELPWD